MCLRAVPHDTKDDVLEKFLSKILPGSGTVSRSDYRQSHHATQVDRTTSSRPAAGSTAPTVVWQSAKRAPAVAAATRSPVATPVKSALSLRKTKRVVCNTVSIELENMSDGSFVQMAPLCRHISDETLLPAAPEIQTQ